MRTIFISFFSIASIMFTSCGNKQDLIKKSSSTIDTVLIKINDSLSFYSVFSNKKIITRFMKNDGWVDGQQITYDSLERVSLIEYYAKGHFASSERFYYTQNDLDSSIIEKYGIADTKDIAGKAVYVEGKLIDSASFHYSILPERFIVDNDSVLFVENTTYKTFIILGNFIDTAFVPNTDTILFSDNLPYIYRGTRSFASRISGEVFFMEHVENGLLIKHQIPFVKYYYINRGKHIYLD